MPLRAPNFRISFYCTVYEHDTRIHILMQDTSATVCRASNYPQGVTNCAEIKPLRVFDSSEQCKARVGFGGRLSDVMCGGLKFFPQTN